jgi:hypothetical protein
VLRVARAALGPRAGSTQPPRRSAVDVFGGLAAQHLARFQQGAGARRRARADRSTPRPASRGQLARRPVLRRPAGSPPSLPQGGAHTNEPRSRLRICAAACRRLSRPAPVRRVTTLLALPRPRLSASGLGRVVGPALLATRPFGLGGGAYRGAISGGLNGPALSAPACLQPSRARLNTAASSLPAAWLRLARQQSHARWRRLLRATIGRSPVFRLFDSAVAVAAAVPADLQRGCSLARAGVQQACGRSVG